MDHEFLKYALADIQIFPMKVDETTNISNVEQLTLVIRWVGHDICVHDEFPYLYRLSSTNAEKIVGVISDVLLHFCIPFFQG